MKIRARVFHKDGNRFLIPGYWCNEDDDDWQGMSISSILCNGMMLGVVAGLDSKQEWLEVEATDEGTADLINVPYRMIGRGFANGAMDILLISGSLFEEAMADEFAP